MAAVISELTSDGYTYRFRHDERRLEEAEGAFLLCGFWLALAAHQTGQEAEAIANFERNRAACGPAGLLTEEFDVVERQVRGNAPQAFVHALLLECATSLSNLLTAEGTAPMAVESPASAIDGSELSSNPRPAGPSDSLKIT